MHSTAAPVKIKDLYVATVAHFPHTLNWILPITSSLKVLMPLYYQYYSLAAIECGCYRFKKYK